MHLPWRHSDALTEARSSGFVTLSAGTRLQESLRDASDVETIATERGVPIIEPFAPMQTRDGVVRILGPSQRYYEELLRRIESPSRLAEARVLLSEAFEKAKRKLVKESIDHETLGDNGVTSPQNNTSVITLLTFDDYKLLFTADAGIPALEQVLDRIEADGFAAGDYGFVQIPHHGSRRNVGPAVLDRLLGPKGQTDTHSLAVVSAPKKNPENKHPAKKTENAFTRRGYDVHRTQGVSKYKHSAGAPNRDGYSNSTPVGLHEYVDEDSES